MVLFTAAELREVISARVLAGDMTEWTKQPIRHISLDTRTLRRGDLFLAMRGIDSMDTTLWRWLCRAEQWGRLSVIHMM